MYKEDEEQWKTERKPEVFILYIQLNQIKLWKADCFSNFAFVCNTKSIFF